MSSHFAIIPLLVPQNQTGNINIEAIKAKLDEGLDDCPPDDRCFAWLTLFGVYPINSLGWSSLICTYKFDYEKYIADLKISDWHLKIFPQIVQHDNFGLPRNDVMRVIHGDIIRTGHHIYCLRPLPVPDSNPDSLHDQFAGHYRRMERILYVFSQLNPGVGYMQGFNELLQPLYYVVALCQNAFQDNYNTIEALVFQMYMQLLTRTNILDMFTINEKSSTIMKHLTQYNHLLEYYLPKAHKILTTNGVEPICYSFRWFSLLYTQEFEMPNVLELWDAIIGHIDDVILFSLCIGVGILKQLEPRLESANYSQILDMTQTIPITDVSPCIQYAKSVYIQQKGFSNSK